MFTLNKFSNNFTNRKKKNFPESKIVIDINKE